MKTTRKPGMLAAIATGLARAFGLNGFEAPPMPVKRHQPSRPGFGNRRFARSRYTGRILREIRASAIRFDGAPRRECSRRVRQMERAKAAA